MTIRHRLMLGVGATAALVAAVVGCGLGIRSPDLFLLTRMGQGDTLTMLINDGGSIKCNDRAPRPLAEPLLLRARDLATTLDADAKQRLNIPSAADSVARYTVKLQDGTISFPDTAASSRHELGEVELFTIQAAQQACGLSG